MALFNSKKQENIPSDFQRKTFWLALTGISGTIVVALIIGFFWLAGITLGYLQQVLLPIAIAGIIAYLLEPIVSWLERRKIKRTFSVLLVLLTFLGIMTGILSYVVPKIVEQTNTIISQREKYFVSVTEQFDNFLKHPVGEKLVDYYYETTHAVPSETKEEKSVLNDLFQKFIPGKQEEKAIVPDTSAAPNLNTQILDVEKAALPDASNLAPGYADEEKLNITKEKLLKTLEKNSASYAKSLWKWLYSGREVISGGIAWLIGGILIPIFVFVFLKESRAIAERWTDILPIRASRFKQEVVDTLTEINGYLIAFFRGQMIVSLIDGCLIGICLTIMGLPYAVVIGAAVGILGIIPYIGIFAVFLPTLLLTWATWGDWSYLVWVSVIFLGCNQIDSWLIQPKIVGNAVGLHEVTVIFSVIFWSFIFGGVVGALLAVPLSASVKVIFQRYVWMNIGSKKELENTSLHEKPA